MAKHRGKRKKRPLRDATDTHHWTPKVRFRKIGERVDHSENNVSILRVSRHRALHQLFKTLTLEESIEELLSNGFFLQTEYPIAWEALFKSKDIDEAAALLLRLHRLKRRCTSTLTGVCLIEVRNANRGEVGDINSTLVFQQRVGVSRFY